MSKTFAKEETVRFKHVDFAGIVFYPRFLEMLNDLVEDFFAEILNRPFSEMHQTNMGIPTVNLKVQFKKPARIGDVLTKSLWIIKLGASSIVCGFKFENQHKDICLEGEVTLVNVSLDKQNDSIESTAFTQEIKSKLEDYLQQH